METNQKSLKTWSHLAKQRRKPSEYDVVTKKLHYSTNNPDAPWELAPNAPMNNWYKKYRNNSKLKNDDWDGFSDPDELVYRTYNLLQDGQESYVFSLFDQFSDRGHDSQIDKDWVFVLAQIYTPLRFLFHGIQMSSSYLAQIAPSSTITNCATFQTADYLRFTTHTAYRTFELSRSFSDLEFNKNERMLWENSEIFQGFRKIIEKNLIAYDWGECFVSLCLVVIPGILEGVLRPLSLTAKHNNDLLMSLLIDSQIKDIERHQKWAKALYNYSVKSNPESPSVIHNWVEEWSDMGVEAVKDYINGVPGSVLTPQDVVAQYKTTLSSFKI